MKIMINNILYAIADALDYVEAELLGATTNHDLCNVRSDPDDISKEGQDETVGSKYAGGKSNVLRERIRCLLFAAVDEPGIEHVIEGCTSYPGGDVAADNQVRHCKKFADADEQDEESIVQQKTHEGY